MDPILFEAKSRIPRQVGDRLRLLGGYEPEGWRVKVQIKVSWEDLDDVVRYTKLLLDSTVVELPDHSVMYTIENLCDKSPEFTLEVIKQLGLTGMKSTLENYLELLWFLNISGAPIIHDALGVEYISGLSELQLLEVLGPSYYHDTDYSQVYAHMMYTALTGKSIWAEHRDNPRKGNFVVFPPGKGEIVYREGRFIGYVLNARPGVSEPATNGFMPPLGTEEYPDLHLKEMWDQAHSYGASIFRIVLYLYNDFLEEKEEFRPLESPYDIFLREFFLSSIQRDKNPHPTRFEMIPFILAYQKGTHINALKSIFRERKELLPELYSIVAEYATGDNAVELASKLGMMFPPHAKAPGDFSNYFLDNLNQQIFLVKEEKLPPLRFDICSNAGLEYYSEKVLVETYKPEKWESSEDLRKNIHTIIARHQGIIRYEPEEGYFIRLPGGHLFIQSSSGMTSTHQKIVDGEAIENTLEDYELLKAAGFLQYGEHYKTDPQPLIEFRPRSEDYLFGVGGR